MENKKGSGIFLGVVSIATLVVAIIGATFAFFSANAASNENAVEVEAYQFTVGMTVASKVNTKGKFIPLNPETAVTHEKYTNNMSYALNVGTNSNICIADNGFQVCELYELTFNNTGTDPVMLDGTIQTTLNEAGTGGNVFKNLKAQIVDFNEGSSDYSLSATHTAVALPETLNAPVALTSSSIEVPTGQSKLYLVVWLNETSEGVEQSKEMGAKYNGQIIFNSTVGGQLTGTFTISG